MNANTPQKKASIQFDHKSQIKNNSSCPKHRNEQIFRGNQHLQRSIFNPKVQESSLKNSHAMLNKKGKGALGIGRKYAKEDNIFRKKTQLKEYREVVMSDQFVRSSKLYKMLKQQVAIADGRHLKQIGELQQIYQKEDQQTKQAKTSNHQLKLQLWELRNQLIQLKSMHEEEQQENRKLVEEYQYMNGEEGEGEGEEGEGEEQYVGGEEGQEKQQKQKHQIQVDQIQINSGTKQKEIMDNSLSEYQLNDNSIDNKRSEKGEQHQQIITTNAKSETNNFDEPE